MSVQFVIGRSGSGKTHRCVHAITEAMRADPLGPPIYWIVPKQATFMAERALTCAAGAFCRARVVSFEQLGRDVFAQTGGNAIPEITPLGRQMVIGHLLRKLQGELRFFASSARQPGLAAELDAAFAEFERAGKTPGEVNVLITDLEQAKSLDVDQVSLLAKLRDLRLVYDAYAGFLDQERLDQHQRLRQVLGCIDDCRSLRDATVYVDGFTEFNDYERRFLAGVAKVCRRMEVMLLLDGKSPVLDDPHNLPDDDSLFHQTEQTYRRLHFAFAEAGVAVEDPLKLDAVHRFTNPSLLHVERTFAQSPTSASSSEEAAGVDFVIAPHPRGEVDHVARQIRALWRAGLRLRDVAVLTRDVDTYQALIDQSFREHGVAYFVDRRRGAAHHPLLQFVRSLFQIVRFDWPNEAVIALMKSGLAGIEPAEADEVENYVALHRIRGLAWQREEPWTYRRQLRSDEHDGPPIAEQPETIDTIRRRVVDRLRPSVSLLRLHEMLSVREIATELFTVLERFDVRATLAAWASAAAPHDPEHAAEHGQVWAEFVGLCEQMVDLLGEERVTLADFVDVLESGLERFDLAITPPTVDQVLVGQIDRTRCPPELKAAFVLGLNDGEFPRAGREASVLSEPERRELRRRKVELDADRHRRLRDENLLGYIAFTRASQRLIVSRAVANEHARATCPSAFWDELRALLPDGPVTQVPQDAQGDTRFVETPRQVLVGLMQWARSVGRSEAPETQTAWPALYQWLANYGNDADDAIARMRRLAWRAVGYSNDAQLASDLAAQLFATPLEVTARQLETFATCPFKHFVRYGLGITTRDAPGVTALDLSRVYHQVLDIVVADALEKRADWHKLADAVPRESIHDFAQAVGQTIRGELMLSTARNKYLLDRIERTLEQIVASQAEMMRRGQFRPRFTALNFGEQGRLPALRVTTPKGRELLVRGAIDRVDVLPDGKHAAVFDYKFSVGPLSMQEVYYGISLQLLTYLLVLQASGTELASKPLTPVAAFYLPLSRRLGDVAHPDDAMDPADPRFHLRIKPRGVFDADFLPAFDAQLQNGASEVIAAYVKQDGTLGRRGASDVAAPQEFAALLAYVQRRIGELADEIVAGRVGIAPYRINRATPCPRCKYRSVCRFEPSINRYANLQPMGREEVLARIVEGGARGE